MIPLLLTCTLLTAAIASATVWFLRKLTRRSMLYIRIDASKVIKQLDAISAAFRKSSLSFMAFSAVVEGLENPALKHWAKTQP